MIYYVFMYVLNPPAAKEEPKNNSKSTPPNLIAGHLCLLAVVVPLHVFCVIGFCIGPRSSSSFLPSGLAVLPSCWSYGFVRLLGLLFNPQPPPLVALVCIFGPWFLPSRRHYPNDGIPTWDKRMNWNNRVKKRRRSHTNMWPRTDRTLNWMDGKIRRTTTATYSLPFIHNA